MTTKSEPLTLAAVAAQFADWRQTRYQWSTPAVLKAQAVELLATHSPSQVVQGLKINHATFKRWRQEVGDSPVPAFVSLPTTTAVTAVDDRIQLKVARHRLDGEAVSIEATLNERQWRWAVGLLVEREQ